LKNFNWGRKGFDLKSKLKMHVEVDQLASLKADQKPNADDYTSDLLAEAEFILNHADEFLVGIEEEMLAA
jgi:hypothetical protein